MYSNTSLRWMAKTRIIEVAKMKTGHVSNSVDDFFEKNVQQERKITSPIYRHARGEQLNQHAVQEHSKSRFLHFQDLIKICFLEIPSRIVLFPSIIMLIQLFLLRCGAYVLYIEFTMICAVGQSQH